MAEFELPPFLSDRTLRHFVQDPHARRMMAGLVAIRQSTNPHDWSMEFLRLTPPEGVAEIFEKIPTAVPELFLSRGWALNHEESLKKVIKNITRLNGTSSFNCATVEDIANPVFTSKLLAEAGNFSYEGMTALAANPNCPPGWNLTDGDKYSRKKEPIFVAAIAKHGDLENEENRKTVFAFLDSANSGGVERVCNVLGARKDLPKSMITPLVDSLSRHAKAAYMEALYRNPVHVQMAEGGETATFAEVGGEFVLSPAMGEKALVSKMTAISDRATKLRMVDDNYRKLVTHKNSPLELIEDYINDSDFEKASAFLVSLCRNRNPHAEKVAVYLRAQHGTSPSLIATPPETSRDGLNWVMSEAMNSKSSELVIAAAGHPNFDWNAIDTPATLPFLSKDHTTEFACCEALRGNPSPKRIQEVLASDTPWPIVFNPAVSGVRLEQLAKTSPHMCAIAALHPNGRDIPLDSITNRTVLRNVRAIRATLPTADLPGRCLDLDLFHPPEVLSI